MTTPIILSPQSYAGVVLLSALVGAGLALTIFRYRRAHRPKELLNLAAGCCLLAAFPLMFAGARAGQALLAAALVLAVVGGWAFFIRDLLAKRRKRGERNP